MRSYNEIKEILEKECPLYFELLGLDMQIRGLMFLHSDIIDDKKAIRELLDRNLNNYLNCRRITAETYSNIKGQGDLYKYYYECDLKKAREIKTYNLAKDLFLCKSDINKTGILYQELKKFVNDPIELKYLYNKYSKVL